MQKYGHKEDNNGKLSPISINRPCQDGLVYMNSSGRGVHVHVCNMLLMPNAICK